MNKKSKAVSKNHIIQFFRNKVIGNKADKIVHLSSSSTQINHDNFLVNRSDIYDICNKYIKKQQVKSGTGAACTFLFGILLPEFLSSGFEVLHKILYSIAAGLCLLFFIIWVVICYKSRKKTDVLGEIYQKALEKSDYNALFLITRNLSSKEPEVTSPIQLMTTPHDEIGTPYIVYYNLKEEGLIRGNEIDTEELIKRFANSIHISPKDIRIEYIKQFSEIKRTSTDPNNEKMIRYEYYKVSIPSGLREKFEKRYQWKYISALLEDPRAMSRNAVLFKDVYTYLIANGVAHESFYEVKGVTPIKIIWNMTNKCGYKCNICATHRESNNELKPEEKAKLLWSICSIGIDKIRELDFSGGDPLIDSDNWDIILDAQQYLGYEKVCITTTGKGIKKVKQERPGILHDLLYNCEVTVDGNEDSKDDCSIRAQQGYGFNNRITIEDNINPNGHLTVNIPILECKTNDAAIRQLVKRIHEIHPKGEITCSLLRLMPSGKMSNFDTYPKDYNPIKFVKVFEKEAKNYDNLRIHKHCALQCFFTDDNVCNMLTKKIGIDNEGNVFACAWGGYINDISDVKQNPFYLGNAYNERLINILNGSRARKIKEAIEKGTSCCRLFNYYLSESSDIYNDTDIARTIKGSHKHVKRCD